MSRAQLIYAAVPQLRPEEWEWSPIGDNNMLAWEVADRVARLEGTTAPRVFEEVATRLRELWRECYG